MAAVLRGGPGAAASHKTAAALWKLEGIDGSVIEITTPRNLDTRTVIAHRTAGLASCDVTKIRNIPTTNPVRTLIDVAGALEEVVLETALDDALSRGLVRLPSLSRRIDDLRSGRHKGLSKLSKLVAEREPGRAVSESALETRLVRLMREAGLPEPVSQHQVTNGGKLVARLDFAYPHALLGIEADGFYFHGRKQRWQSDARKRTALASLGWRLMIVTWNDVTQNPQETVRRVRQALEHVQSRLE